MRSSSSFVALCVCAGLLVTACGSGGDAPGTPAAPSVPAPPAGVLATPGNAQATLSWPAVPGATTYNLYWSTSPGVTKGTGTRIAGAASPYVHGGLVNGAAHYWIVTAANAAGESVASAQVSAVPSASPSPAAPAALSATRGDQQVTVSWGAVNGATSYNLYWSTSAAVSQTNGTKVTGATSPYPHLGLANGTTYHYVVTAVNLNGESTDSPRANATPAPAPPGAPTGVVATAGDGQVTVSWPAVTGAASYVVYWSTTAGVTPANGTQVTGASNPFVHMGLANGTRYYYVVTAVNAGGGSPPSSQASAVPMPPLPAAPAGVTASPGDAQVTVAWQAVGGATAYHLYWSTSPGVSQSTGNRIASVTSPYLHAGRSNGTTYHYVVTAANLAGESPDSGIASATPSSTLPPPAPVGVVATAGDARITLTWPLVPGATRYNVYASNNQGVTKATGFKYASVSSPYLLNGCTNGFKYYFVVTAQNGTGESPESMEVMGIPAAPTRSISGTVTYGGVKTGRVYVEATCQPGCVFATHASGTSLPAPGAFTIRGVEPGTYTVVAYMDTLGQGAQNASFPSGKSAPVTVSTADIPGVAVALADPGVAPPRAPSGLRVHPGTGGALVFWDAVWDPYYVESVTGYLLAWGTDPGALTTVDLVARDDASYLVPLDDGAEYFFKVASKAGAAVSAFSPLLGPILVGPGSGGHTLSGTVSFPAATGPLWIVLFDRTTHGYHVARIAYPVSPQPFAVAGLASGAFYAFAILDQNRSGVIDPGDLRNWSSTTEPPTVTLTGDATADLSLAAQEDAAAAARTGHVGVDGLETFQVDVAAEDGAKLVVAAALVSGPGIAGPIDLARSYGGYGLQTRQSSTRPAAGVPFRLALTYADGSTQTVDLAAQFLELPRNLAASPTPSATVPTFFWTAPATLPPSSYGYELSLSGADRSWEYPSSGLMPGAQLSVRYDVDGTAQTSGGFPAPSLSMGVPYTWTLVIRDSGGNVAARSAVYIP